jgi:hypothetical protein
MFRAARKHRHLTVPAAVPVGFLAAGAVAASFHQPDVTGLLGGFAAFTVHREAPRKWDRSLEQWYARASAVAAGGWLTWVSASGMMHTAQLSTLAAGAAVWGGAWWKHKRPRRSNDTVIRLWDEWWRHYAPGWSLPGTEVYDVTAQGVMVTLHVQLQVGKQSQQNVDQVKHLIESALQGYAAPGMTRIEALRDGSKILVRIKRENPLDDIVDWYDAVQPTSVTGNVGIGRGEDGEWIYRPLLGNWFIIGATGSGKSNELSVFMSALTGCPDARIWLIDRKGGRSARPWLRTVDWLGTEIEEIRDILRAGIDEIRARSKDAYTGDETLTPTPEIPAIFIIIDEAHNVTSSSISGDRECQALLADIASEGRGVAVHTIVLTQYGALMESVGTEQTRMNLRNRMCFAVSKPEHGAFALTDFAKLDASKLENPGEFYWQAGPKSPSSPCRGPEMSHDLVRSIAAFNSQIQRPPLQLFAVAHQDSYDTRRDRLDETFLADLEEQETTVRPDESPTAAAYRIELEAADVPAEFPGPLPPDDVLLDEMTRRMRKFAAMIQDAPPAGVRPVHLAEQTDFSPSWVFGRLAELRDAGVIRKANRGRYTAVPGQDVWKAMERLAEERAQFTAEARRKVSA